MVVVLLVSVLGALQQMLTAHGLDFASYDWGWVMNCAIIAMGGYLTKNFISDSDGKVVTPVGKIG